MYAFLRKLNKLRVVFWLAVVVLGVAMLAMQVQENSGRPRRTWRLWPRRRRYAIR